MNKFIATAAAVCLALGSAAQAATVKISEFDITSFDSAVGLPGGNFVVQDFEDIGNTLFPTTDISDPNLGGQISTPTLDTSLYADNVGEFRTIGGTGSGTTCDASNGDCKNLFLSGQEINGQGNSVPEDGRWSLNANDTSGIQWDVVYGEAGAFFNRAVFAIMDAADQHNTTVTISVDGYPGTGELIALDDGQRKLIVIDFAAMVNTATIRIVSSNLDDSYSIDGASVGVVPLPAGGLLLLTGLGALALRRRRKAA